MNIYQRYTLVKSNQTLDHVTSHIYQTLISYAHQQKFTCFPAVKDIAALAALGDRCVRKHLRLLEKEKLIAITPRTMPNGRSTSNLYTLLGLKEAQEELVNTCKAEPLCNPNEALHLSGKNKNTYGDLEHSDRKSQSQKKTAIESVAEGQSQKKTAIESVAEGQSQKKTAIESVAEDQSQKKTAIESVAEDQSQRKSIRFEGELTSGKIVEIYNLYTRQGWIKRCYDSFFTFVANCLMTRRLRKKNPFGWITWLYKNRMDRKLITATDERLAGEEIRSIQEMGLMPNFSEKQQPLQAQSPTPQAPAPPPARISSRPAMDWPDKNLPETGRESALYKKVKYQQVTHVHPRWIEGLNCWIAKFRIVEGGKLFYEEHPLTEDGWYQIGFSSEIVALKNPQGNQISKEELIRLLADGFSAP